MTPKVKKQHTQESGHQPSALSAFGQSPGRSRLSRFIQTSSMIPSVMALRVEIQRGRLVVWTLCTLLVIVSVVVVFGHGVDLTKIVVAQDSRDPDAEAKLVDHYNSYSASVVSLFGRPIEILVGLIVQVFILRFASSSLLQPETPWQIRGGVFCSAAVVAYLVNNGFNAVNAQLRQLNIRPVISASDLSLAVSTNDSLSANDITNFSHIVSEATPANPIANTVLRNLVLPRIWSKERVCTGSVNTQPLRPDTADFGFPSRSWQREMLPNALMADAHYFPWFPSILTDTLDKMNELHDVPPNAPANESQFEAVSDLLGILPRNTTSELDKRIFFLSKSRKLMQNQLAGIENGSEIARGFEFSLVSITSTIHFDAVSFEVGLPVEEPPQRSFRCGPLPNTCMFERQKYGNMIEELDPPAQNNAFASCINQITNDDTIYIRQGDNGVNGIWTMDCPQTSNTSLLVVSVGKRIVAENTVFDVVNPNGGYYTLSASRLRKIYTFTVGRLAWTFDDLSTTFSAACDIQDGSRCVGLQYPLARNTARLVVSARSLPLNLLVPFAFEGSSTQRILALVRIQETAGTATKTDTVDYEIPTGDILLPHNVDVLTWDASVRLSDSTCSRWVEDRLHAVLNNHFYIEHRLQPSYIAAMFFLFQDATVRDVLMFANKSESLQFDRNIQEMAVRLSIQPQT